MFGYFLTGFRHLVAIVAGTARLRISAFALFTYTGALIWTVTFISLGYFLGEQWTHIAGHAKTIAIILTTFVCAAGAIFFLKRRRIKPTAGKNANSARED